MTHRKQVLEYYPNAKPINLSTITKKSKYFVIMSNDRQLGKGQSKKAAWKSASRNINQ